MKKYCIDTSGITNPLEQMPEDIHVAIWSGVSRLLTGGVFAVTTEIYDEMTRIPGSVGASISGSKRAMVLEVGDSSWDWPAYIDASRMLHERYEPYVSEWHGGMARTVGLNDLSIVALAIALRLPLVSMEVPVLQAGHNPSTNKRRIPDICTAERVEHLSFNDLLRREGIRG